MKINWIELENIKSFKEPTKIVLNPDYNFVVGTNGSGKTTLFQALTSCLLILVPQQRTESQSQGTIKKLRFTDTQRTVNLPRNFDLSGSRQNIKIEVSFEDSKDGLIEEIESYIQIFQANKKYIEEYYWNQEGLIPNSQNFLNAFKAYSGYTFEFEFDVSENSVSLNGESRHRNQGVIDVLELIETQRVIYDQLFRLGKTEEVVERGFRVIYLGADRMVGFPPEISLARGNIDEFLNNTAYSRNADLINTVYSSGSFDYINQTLTRISEKFIYLRWQKQVKDPLPRIDEYVQLQTTIKQLLDLEFVIDPPGSPYETMRFSFKSNGRIIQFDQMSSGEKSLIYYLFTLANPDIKNSFVIFDEAEIHLHGNMQDSLLDIVFNGDLNNQHFISTHSPKLINKLTISSVLRFYKNDGVTAYINFRSDTDLGSDYDVIRLINGQNNEKVFFADKVVLVEGIKDRILVEALLKNLNLTKQIIEVIDVGGKLNLKLYQDYLNSIKVKNYIIADFDYLYNLKKAELSELFVTDTKRVDEIIKRKGSGDRVSLIESIEAYTVDGDKAKLEKTVEYLKSRGITLKSSLAKEELKKLNTAVKELRTSGIFIICEGLLMDSAMYTGEIEDYLKHIAAGKNNQEAINTLVEYLGKDSFLNDIKKKCDSKVFEELATFMALIVYDDEAKAQDMIKSLES